MRRYARRFWTEEVHGDEMSRVFQWQRSRAGHSVHGARLMVLLALAMRLAINVGSGMLKHGLRRLLEPRGRRG